MITVNDIVQRHPAGIRSITDQEYAKLADKLFKLLNYKMLTLEKERIIRKTCIDVALYFEDLKSGTHQFEVFAKLYKDMFGFYLPFYKAEDASSPTAQLDAMTFVLWHSLISDDESQIWNPLNNDLRLIAQDILELWNKEKNNLPANDNLVDYLFCEETQNDPHEIINVLIWIESRSYFGKFYTNYSEYDIDSLNIKHIPNLTGKLIQKHLEERGAFANMAWPLSLPAQKIYAELIRAEMNDPEDEIAADIETIQSTPFALYRIEKVESTSFRISDFYDTEYNVQYSSEEDFKLATKAPILECGLFSYKGKWYLNGFHQIYNTNSKSTSNLYSGLYEDYKEAKNDRSGIFYKDSGANIDHKRLLFFKNFKEFEKWAQNHAEIKHDVPKPKGPLMAFIEPDGTISLSESVKLVKHPKNPFYDQKEAKSHAMTPWETCNFSPELALYLIEHDLVPDACFRDFKWEERGRLLFQNNIDFIVRCFRRDINRTDIFRKRDKEFFLNEQGKKTFSEFVYELMQELQITSRGGKKTWYIIECNEDTTVIIDFDKDENKNKDKKYSIPTKKLYEAYSNLNINEMTIDKLTPFVGKENGPAAAALMYNIVGTGRGMHNLSKIANFLSLMIDKNQL